MTTLLWDKPIINETLKKSYEILSKTTHQATGNRLLHLTAWIQYSEDPELSYKFLLANINCPYFYPFIDLMPDANISEIEQILKKIGGTNFVKLSTINAGKLTIISVNSFINKKLISINNNGITIGQYNFKTINDLIENLKEPDWLNILN